MGSRQFGRISRRIMRGFIRWRGVFAAEWHTFGAIHIVLHLLSGIL